MDLLVAIMQRAAIHNVGSYTGNGRARQCAWRHATDDHAVDDLVWSADGLDERAAIGAQRRTERFDYTAGVSVLGNRHAGIPSLEAIDISRFDCAARMLTTRLAAVFNIHTE